MPEQTGAGTPCAQQKRPADPATAFFCSSVNICFTEDFWRVAMANLAVLTELLQSGRVYQITSYIEFFRRHVQFSVTRVYCTFHICSAKQARSAFHWGSTSDLYSRSFTHATIVAVWLCFNFAYLRHQWGYYDAVFNFFCLCPGSVVSLSCSR